MFRGELALLFSAVSAVLFSIYGAGWMEHLGEPIWFGGITLWLLATILAASFGAVRHAEALARIFGEPYGTLILTIAVTTIEVSMIASVMLSGDGNPEFARDTMFAVIMIVINGLVGLSLLLGGLRFNEQQYNLQGANAYLVVIIPLAGLGLILPDATISTPDSSFTAYQAAFLSLLSVGLYSVFLLIQTRRHQGYFIGQEKEPVTPADTENREIPYSTLTHTLLLLGYLFAVIMLAEQIAKPVEHSIDVLGAPAALGGLFVAALILMPEGMSGLRAALQNNLQRAVNVLLGSVLATISLTIPVVLVLGLLTSTHITLGLPASEVVLLVVTLMVCMTTFSSARTNILQGAVHLLLFFAYLMLIFQP